MGKLGFRCRKRLFKVLIKPSAVIALQPDVIATLTDVYFENVFSSSEVVFYRLRRSFECLQ
jgi:hypothetical protein